MQYNLHVIDYLEIAMGSQRRKRIRVDREIHRKIQSLQGRWDREVDAI